MASIFFLSGVWSLSRETYSNIGGTIQPQKDYIPRGKQVDFEPPDEPGQRQSMVLKRLWKGFGKIGTHKPEGAGDKDVHYGWWLIYNGLLRLKTKK